MEVRSSDLAVIKPYMWDANTTVVLTRLDGYDPERGVKIVG